MDTKQKYIRLAEYDVIIVFPQIIEHSKFRHMNPISAGFCYIDKDKVKCFGKSISLDLDGKDDDSFIATRQVFGCESAKELM